MTRWVAALLVALAACGGADTASDPTTTTTEPPIRYEVDATVLENAQHGPELCLGVIAAVYPPNCGGVEITNWNWDDIGRVEQERDIRWTEVHVVGTFDGEAFTLTETPDGPEITSGFDLEQDFSVACDAPTGDLSLNYGDAVSATSMGQPLPAIPNEVATWVTNGDPFVVNVVVLPGSAEAATVAARQVWAGGLCVVERDAPTVAELHRIQNEVSDAPDDSPLGNRYSVGSDPRRGVVTAEILLVDEEATEYAQERWGDLVELTGLLQPLDEEAS